MNQQQPMYVHRPESGGKKFWRIVFGSMVGFILSCIIFCLLSVFLMIGMVASFSSSSTTKIVADNSVLKLDLSTPIVEQAVPNPFEGFESLGFGDQAVGLNDILASIKVATTDNKIKGIYMNIGFVQSGTATIKEIRDALLKFKESGKFIIAYSEYYSQGAYYLVSLADKIYLNPNGQIDFKGVSASVMFYKGLLEKLDAEMQIIRHGQFKSAVEPFMLDKMSEANNKQYTLMIQGIWNTYLDAISASRNISKENLLKIADELTLRDAKTAMELKMIDGIAYSSDVEEELKTLCGIKENKKLNFITLNNYAKSTKTLDFSSDKKDKIAVIYAQGNIVDGKANANNNPVIASEDICKTIRKAYKDESVKAIVLRINSGGGSGLASDIIWHELELAKQAGKIIVTSMGDYAASGGYYIACNSDYIVAQPNTLTGSIGVFGILPNAEKFLKNKLGITVDVVKTSSHADFPTVTRGMDEYERNVMQNQVEEFYTQFITRVSEGRKMKIEAVDSIGQGRVWAGVDAIKIGLVDELGTMEVAIQKAAELANLDNYSILELPKQTDWFTKLLNQQKEDAVEEALKTKLGDLYYTVKGVQNIINAKGIQARMPMEIVIE
jgi:protease-4